MPRTRGATRTALVTTFASTHKGGTFRWWRKVNLPARVLDAVETGVDFTPRGRACRADTSELLNARLLAR